MTTRRLSQLVSFAIACVILIVAAHTGFLPFIFALYATGISWIGGTLAPLAHSEKMDDRTRTE